MRRKGESTEDSGKTKDTSKQPKWKIGQSQTQKNCVDFLQSSERNNWLFQMVDTVFQWNMTVF
jgi:hypothetical protein